VKIYEKACQFLDITVDWQIRVLLSYDVIALSDRSFSFNDFRAFATAIGPNLQELTLHSVNLTSRSLHVLCQALKQCHHLTLLVNKSFNSNTNQQKLQVLLEIGVKNGRTGIRNEDEEKEV